jgi:predicted metal-dependent hydrolase
LENADGLDPYYAGWLACFNRGQFYEAHDVLEVLWLGQRRGPDDFFYRGLIQLAGAFVHLQKNRLRPADALFALATQRLGGYPTGHHRLPVPEVLSLIRDWRAALASGEFKVNPLIHRPPPQLSLMNLTPADAPTVLV